MHEVSSGINCKLYIIVACLVLLPTKVRMTGSMILSWAFLSYSFSREHCTCSYASVINWKTMSWARVRYLEISVCYIINVRRQVPKIRKKKQNHLNYICVQFVFLDSYAVLPYKHFANMTFRLSCHICMFNDVNCKAREPSWSLFEYYIWSIMLFSCHIFTPIKASSLLNRNNYNQLSIAIENHTNIS